MLSQGLIGQQVWSQGSRLCGPGFEHDNVSDALRACANMTTVCEIHEFPQLVGNSWHI